LTEPKIVFDFEFSFGNGERLHRSIPDGGWSAKALPESQETIFQFRYEDGTVEELIVNRSQAAYISTIKREVTEEPTFENTVLKAMETPH
jgi:hypothetical protein